MKNNSTKNTYMLKDQRVINILRTEFLEGEITEDYLRNLLDRSLIIMEEFLAIIDEPYKSNE